MLSQYYTVEKQGFDEIIIQKSRFIGYVRRVETEEEAQDFIQEIKKKHHDATHNCSAYMIGEHDQIQKANDDGEPSGTAGFPMLEVIKKLGLKDTAVVVTRYFGGIKLGAGGLIRAYGSTTSQAIKTTGLVKRELMQAYKVEADYGLLGKIENAVRNKEDYILENINYTEQVEFIIYVPTTQEDTFQSWLIDFTNDQVNMTKTDQKYVEHSIESTES